MATTKKKRVKRLTNQGKLSQTTRKNIRKSNRDDMPSHVFLRPSDKAYPVKEKDKNGRWVYSLNLLLAAQKRATMNGDKAIAAKAKALYARYSK